MGKQRKHTGQLDRLSMGYCHVFLWVLAVSHSVSPFYLEEVLPQYTAIALNEVGLLPQLFENGNVTYFAPSDAAFVEFAEKGGSSVRELLQNPALPELLRFHMVPGNWSVAELYENRRSGDSSSLPGASDVLVGQMSDEVLTTSASPAAPAPAPQLLYISSASSPTTLIPGSYIDTEDGEGFGDLITQTRDRLMVSFSSTCSPCIGRGAGPYQDSAFTLHSSQASNGQLFEISNFVIPPHLCGAFEKQASWQCCDGCDGCPTGLECETIAESDFACPPWCAANS